MAWHIEMQTEGIYLVLLDRDLKKPRLVIGSIKQSCPHGVWNVEIMWNGPGGDYTATFDLIMEAQGYVRGIEAAQAKLLPLIGSAST